MALTLHLHPLSSFCHKVLFGLYENETPFTSQMTNLQDPKERAEYMKISPFGKIPVLEDSARKQAVIETTVILEYVDQHYPGKMKFFPKDAALCLEARKWDRVFDFYMHIQMQKVVADRMRPEGAHDPTGVNEAKAFMKEAQDLLEKHLQGRQWVVGDALSIADCAALPALFYGGFVLPFAKTHPNVAAYFDRLMARPSVQRVLGEAKPFFKYFPYADAMPAHLK